MKVLRLARRAMGTLFEFVLLGEDETRLRAAGEAALTEIERLEDQLSLFLPTSELSHVNRHAAQRALRVEPRLFALLERALYLGALTGGAFDVTVDAWMEVHGFRGASGLVPAEARRRCGAHLLELEGGTVRFRAPGVRLDLGGIGKGYALDRAAAVLRAHGLERAFLHGGTSTVLALGAPPGAGGWPVGLVDPRDPSRRFGRLRLRDEALSVSSSFGRVVQRGRRQVGHVIDPRSGRPVRRPAAWAIAPSAADTDALATAFLVLGAEGARACVAAEPGTGAIVLDRALTCVGVEPDAVEEPRSAWTVDRRALLATAGAAAAAFAVGVHAPRAAAEEEAPPRALRVALVGVGAQGRLLLGQLVRLENVKVAALCDVRPQALRDALPIAGRDVETYADLAYLLEEETLDALVVATPTHAHAHAALAGLAAGLDVYCEAPLAHTVADALRIAKAAKTAGRVFQVGHLRRTSRLYPHAAEHVGSGAIGRLLQIRASRHEQQSWRRAAADPKEAALLDWRLARATSGGLLGEWGSHVFDLAHWLFQAPPEAVTGMGALLRWRDGRDVDDCVSVLLRYPAGVGVAFDASLFSSYGGEREMIVGDAATILCVDQRKGLLFKEADAVAIGWEQYARSELLGGARGIVLDPEATKYVSHERGEVLGPQADRADAYAALEQFVRAVRGGPAPACGAREGLHATVVAVMAAQAVAARGTVTFDPAMFEI